MLEAAIAGAVSGINAPAVTEVIEIHRFGLPDLETKGLWLHGRLMDLLGDWAPNYLASWIRGLIDNNGFLFLCSPRAVGVAQISHSPLHIRPVVEEVFVFITEDAGVADAQEIYRAMQRWAASLDAEEMVVGTATDVTQKEITKALGPVKMKTIYTAKAG